jgi:hypothetical protein
MELKRQFGVPDAVETQSVSYSIHGLYLIKVTSVTLKLKGEFKEIACYRLCGKGNLLDFQSAVCMPGTRFIISVRVQN